MAKEILLDDEERMQVLNLTIDCLSLQDKINRLNEKTLLFNKQIARNAKTLVKSMDYILNDIGVQLFKVDMQTLEDAIENRVQLLNDISRISPENWQLIAYAAKWANEPTGLKYAQLKALCIAYDGEIANANKESK